MLSADDTYDGRGGAQSLGVAAIADVTMSMKSIQAAYSMGSMSIKMYRQTTDNPGYEFWWSTAMNLLKSHLDYHFS